jgi:translocation and assembly module TamB
MPIVRRPRARRRQPREWGRLTALALCILFAVIGVIPLALGLLVRTSPVRAWAARETARIIEGELGVTARYEVTVQAFPLLVSLESVVVDASDGGSPFLEVERASVRPRIFALLAGQLDVGDIEVIGPRVRAVVVDGELKNLAFKLPQSKEESAPSARLPLSSVAVTDARIDARIDDTHVVTRAVDVDVTVEESDVFEIGLRAGMTRIDRVHPLPGREGEDSVDEDILCRLDARVRLEPDAVLIRRLTLQGSADFDPDPGTAPSCGLEPGDWREVDVRLGALRVSGLKTKPIRASGRVRARLPLSVAHRFADIPFATGSVFIDGEADYDGGEHLPRFTGVLELADPGVEGKLFASKLKGNLTTTTTTVRLADVDVAWGDGKVSIGAVKVEPFAKGIPISAGPIDLKDIEFPALMRDLGAHPQAHVAWSLYEGHVESFKGTIQPLSLEGPMFLKTRGFEIFDRPTTDPQRGHMMSVREGTVAGSFQVREHGVVLSNFHIDTPQSHLRTNVTLGFNAMLDIEIGQGSQIDLSEISPLASLEIGGMADLKVTARGPFVHPKVEGDLAIKNFSLAGFQAGDLESAKVAFEPLVLRLTDARLRHGRSLIRVPSARVDFGGPATVMVDADIDTNDRPHLSIRDFFEIFHFDKDPRFAQISGFAAGVAGVHFSLGGKEDRCGGGYLTVRTAMRLSDVGLFGERFDSGNIDLDLIWDDQLAGTNGMRMELREGSLRKGSGSILATGAVRHGGAVQISAIGSGIPIERLDALGAGGKLFAGTISGVASVGGTLSQLSADADVRVSRIRLGAATLPSSHLRVLMEPLATPPRSIGVTRCGNLRGEEFDINEWQRDLSGGFFRASGDLFGGMVQLKDVNITRQEHKVVRGKVLVKGLELGTLANLIPGVAFAGSAPTGSLSAVLDITKLPVDQLEKADLTLTVSELEVARDGQSLRLKGPSGPIWLVDNGVDIPELNLEARTASGLSAIFKLGGEVRTVLTKPDIDVSLTVDPINLSKLAADIPALERASGMVDARLRVTGPPAALAYSGEARVRKGELSIEGSPLTVSDLDVDIDIGGGAVRLKKATAEVGGGTLEAWGIVPVRGLELGAASFEIRARGVKLPVADGINLTADADLQASYVPGAAGEGERNLPDLKGTVSLTSFSYTRPIAMSVSLGQLTGQPQRTAVETYDPANDVVKFSLNVVSPKPLRFSNNLVDMQLEVTQPGLLLSGTNQRFGARGMLRILPDSKLTLRASEFDVREGYVRFDDPYRIAPKVDVRAQTEYRRYARSAEATAAAEAAAPEGAAGASASASQIANQGGQWRINLHAHGDAEDLKVDLSSDPPLGQEDIVLLLTIGLTRAELDRGLATSLGETVGLEALSALTGADKAVKNIVPLIDEFRFGTGYSSRTGRTEPTVTVGKRITDGVRASVTTGLTENRELRSSVEWKLGRRMSVQGSYDNANDVSSSLLGNIGVDLRWRLEFE